MGKIDCHNGYHKGLITVKALILAAGEGTRLKPLTQNTPKTMLPLHGKPLLEYIVDLLRCHGITELAINLYHQPRAVIDYFGNGERFGVQIHYSLENPILGTAGALSKLRDYFDQAFVVVYGDLLTNLNISSLVDFHQAKQGLATMALYQAENPRDCGIVELNDEGRVLRFVEKPPSEIIFTNLANAGVYMLESEVIDFIPDNTFYDFGHDLFPALLRGGKALYGYPVSDYLIDIGTMENYRRAESDLERGKLK